MDFSTVGTKNFLHFLGGPTQKLLLVPLVLKFFGDFSEDPPKKSEILTVFQNVASDSDAILTAGGENISVLGLLETLSVSGGLIQGSLVAVVGTEKFWAI